MHAQLRPTGIEALGARPWGAHLCVFYESNEDLFEVLIPYLEAGLSNRERCVWVPPPNLACAQVREALTDALPDLKPAMDSGQFAIMPPETAQPQEARAEWRHLIEQAMSGGFEGVRVAGALCRLDDGHARPNLKWEHQPLMMLCTQSLSNCNAADALEIARDHSDTLIKRRGKWESIHPGDRSNGGESQGTASPTNGGNHIAPELDYRSVIDNLPELVARIDINDKILFVNKTFCDVTGLKPEDVIGKGAEVLMQFFPPEDFQRMQRSVMEALTERRFTEIECQVKHPSGAEFTIIQTQFPWYTPDGQLGGLQIISHNVTERKKAEEAIRASEAKYRDLVENAPESVGRIDAQGRFLFVNRQFCEWTGLKQEEVIGRTGEVLIPFMDQANFASMIESVQRTLTRGERTTTDLKFRRRDGDLWVAQLAYPWFLPDGTVGGAEILGRDITQQRRIEESLREQEKRYRQALESVPHGIHDVDLTGTITWSNTAHARIHGYEPGEMVGKKIWDLQGDAEEREKLRSDFSFLLENRPPPETYFNRDRKKDGTPIEVQVDWNYQYDENGELIGFVSVVTDITEKQRAEEERQEGEKRLRTLTEVAHEGIAIHENGTLLLANDQFYRMFGYEKDELLGKYVIPLTVAPESIEMLSQKIASGATGPYEAIGLRKDGSKFPMEIRVREATYRGRQVRIGSILDLTERRAMEKRIVEVSNRERERLRHDLHDGVCQQIAGIGYLARSLRPESKQDPEKQARTAKRIEELALLTARQADDVAKGLQPVTEDPDALFAALADLVRQTDETAGMECRFLSRDLVSIEDHDAACNLYLIAQEAVRNAVRHAKPGSIDVAIEETDEAVEVTVRDDGCGIESGGPARTNGGMGLGIMRYRAQSVGATIEIRPRKKGGTTVQCTWKKPHESAE